MAESLLDLSRSLYTPFSAWSTGALCRDTWVVTKISWGPAGSVTLNSAPARTDLGSVPSHPGSLYCISLVSALFMFFHGAVHADI